MAGVGKLITEGGSGLLRILDEMFDPRFAQGVASSAGDARVGELKKLQGQTRTVETRPMQERPTVRLEDFEGRPFITSMSDRQMAGGTLLDINGQQLKEGVNLRGGQDYMFDNNQGQVWASGASPVSQILKLAENLKLETGLDPIYIPWRMAPTGNDFATQVGETMLDFAANTKNVPMSLRKEMDSAVREVFPEWKGLGSKEWRNQWPKIPDAKRKSIMNKLDKFRDKGGLSVSQARLAVTEPYQANAVEGNIMNVGEIFAGQKGMRSTHPSYPFGVPGQGIGRVENETPVTMLLKQGWRDKKGNVKIPVDPANPAQNELRSLQMKPVGGVLTEKKLRDLLGSASGVGLLQQLQAMIDQQKAVA